MSDIQLQMNVAQGAPPLDPSFLLRPADGVTVYGSANDQIFANVGTGAGIVENNNQSCYQFQLDANGFGRFNVAALDLSLQQASVTAQVVGNAQNHAGGQANFGRYRVGGGHLHAYASTTRGAADGISLCSAYVIVRPTQMDIGDITKLVAKVDGNAWLTSKSGKPQLDYITLDGQGAATINVADASPELVHLTLALPESPDGEFVKVKISFVAFPASQPQFRAQKRSDSKAALRVLQGGERE